MAVAGGDSREWTEQFANSKHDPFAAPKDYYGESHVQRLTGGRPRTLSMSQDYHNPENAQKRQGTKPVRRASMDDYNPNNPRKFLINVQTALDELLKGEDSDGNFQITIEDKGPKVLSLGTANSAGFNKYDVRGTYMLSNLLQELTIAQEFGRKQIYLDEERLHENPVARLHRLIKTTFWDSLTRRIDGSVIDIVAKDSKAERMGDARPRIYVPARAPEQLDYYQRVAKEYAELNLEVVQLPVLFDAHYVKSINSKPGILALAMEEYTDEDGQKDLRGLPFVVPGGRFNELYGWDSYMIALGLLVDDKVDLAKSMVINFCFEIEHYGKILNANRSYYLSRSQPPFLTDMALKVYKKIQNQPDAHDFLRNSILAAIKEYHTVWMAEPRFDRVSKLSRYRPEGLGVPPETEASHFDSVLTPFAARHDMSIDEFIAAYNDGEIKEPELDTYFLHDRAVRESGHDTTYRLEGQCADLATVDLNSLLYKYEIDIASVIRTKFNDKLVIPASFAAPGSPELAPGAVITSAIWVRRAKVRQQLMKLYMWNEDMGMFFDYNTATKKQSKYVSATTFWAMWSGVATTPQATRMVEKALPLLEEEGGLAAGTEESRGELGIDRPNRQWDWPYGWAPQQMLAWFGMEKYGYQDIARRLAYRWLYMITKAFVDYNGVVVEKYDVTRAHEDPHRVDAEYGNQGLDFRGVAREGFGWVNASYEVGLTYIDSHMKRALGALIPPQKFFSATDAELELLRDDPFHATPDATPLVTPLPDGQNQANPFDNLPSVGGTAMGSARGTPAARSVKDPFDSLSGKLAHQKLEDHKESQDQDQNQSAIAD